MGAFEDFVNANLGVRMPLFIDTTTPELSSKSAGSLGSKFVDSTTNFLYEKTGYTNADWVKIAELGDSRGGGGGGGMDFSNFTGGWNIEISGDSTLMFIETSKSLSGSGYFFDASGIIGTGDSMPFVVSESGQVGLNLYTGEEQATGYVTPYQLHVSGVTALSGSTDLEFATKPTLTVVGNTELQGDINSDSQYQGAHYSMLVSSTNVSGNVITGNIGGVGGEFGVGELVVTDGSDLRSGVTTSNGALSVTNPLNDQGVFRVATGVYLPQLTDSQRDGLDLYREGSGALIFNSDHEEFQVHDGIQWHKLLTGAVST